MSVLLILCMYGIWTTVFSFSKVTLQYCPPVFLTGFRMIFAGMLIVCYLFFKRKGSLRINKKQLFSLTILGLFSIYLTNIFEFWGVQYIFCSENLFFLWVVSLFYSAFFLSSFWRKNECKKMGGIFDWICRLYSGSHYAKRIRTLL